MGSITAKRTDRIAAFAERNGIALVANRNNVRISRLAHPALAVLDSGGVPKGDLAAIQIRQAVDLLHDLYSDDELARLEQLAILADEFSVEYNRDPSSAHGSMNPLAGALSLSHYYAALVPRLGEHRGLVILRALLLRVISAGRRHGTAQAGARWIREVLINEPTRHFDEKASDQLAAQWRPSIATDDLADLLSHYFAEKSDAPKLFAQAALEPSTGMNRSTDPRHPPEPEQGKPGDQPIHSPPAPTPYHPSGIVRVGSFKPPPASLEAPPDDEIPPEDLEGYGPAIALDFYQDEDEPLEVETGENYEAVAFEFEQATRHHLEGSLLPDTDRSLTTAESNQIWRHLESNLASQPNAPPLQLAAAVCSALMLITGRRRLECIGAISALILGATNEVDGALQITAETWITTIQTLPRLKQLPPDWFNAVSTEVHLPLPRPLSFALEELTANAAAQIGQSREWHQAWQELRNQLRQECPRFTETRAIHTLAVQAFVQTGHLRDPQWLSGSSLGHSTAAGHYYALPAQDMVSTYRDALASMGIDVESSGPSSQHLVGAPRAAIRWTKAREAVDALANHTATSVRLTKAPLQQVLEGVQRLGTYLALFFGTCTAHRFTSSIARVTRRDFLTANADTNGWILCLVADKCESRELDARVCVLPKIFADQLAAYLRQLERAERLLAGHKDTDANLLNQFRSALYGDGPLWWSTGDDFENTSHVDLNRHALESNWPEWAIPLPLLRHLFASNARRFGITQSDIALQMGHSIGDSIFDACDPVRIPTKPATDSDSCRPAIPMDVGHPVSGVTGVDYGDDGVA